MTFDQGDADAIAKKLGASLSQGRKHEIATFWHEGKQIFHFGIRRSSKEVPHDYIPRQMYLSQGECRKFRSCTLTLESYVQLLKLKQIIPDSSGEG